MSLRGWRAWAALLLGLCGLCALPDAQASSLRFCDRPLTLNAEQKDKLFRLSAVIKTELEQSGQDIALMSRSGLDLARFGQRYSHAGFSLRASTETPWAVRQLYYACDEKRPRIFDQGVTGFLLGTDDPSIGYVSVVFMPSAQAQALERSARDNRRALALLAPIYSANAFAFSTLYQNCNQWVAEMLAAAWSALPPADTETTRAQAQQWLQAEGYAPTVIDARDRLAMALVTAFMPWLHADDHPDEDLHQAHYRISMPASLEGFIRHVAPTSTRVEFCHTASHIVIHRGWSQIAEGCVPGAGDTVVPLD